MIARVAVSSPPGVSSCSTSAAAPRAAASCNARRICSALAAPIAPSRATTSTSGGAGGALGAPASACEQDRPQAHAPSARTQAPRWRRTRTSRLYAHHRAAEPMPIFVTEKPTFEWTAAAPVGRGSHEACRPARTLGAGGRADARAAEVTSAGGSQPRAVDVRRGMVALFERTGGQRNGRSCDYSVVIGKSTRCRAACARCLRPQATCLCALVRPTAHRTEVLVLQHPQETTAGEEQRGHCCTCLWRIARWSSASASRLGNCRHCCSAPGERRGFSIRACRPRPPQLQLRPQWPTSLWWCSTRRGSTSFGCWSSPRAWHLCRGCR